MSNENVVKDWELYESGKKYNNSIRCINGANYYDLVDTLIDFFNGNQWRNLEVTGMRKPVFNIIQKAIRFWVASIAASNTKLDLEPLPNATANQNLQGDLNIADFASSEIMNLFEKFKIDNRIRDALFKAGTIGDVAAHMWFDREKIPYGGAFQDVKGEICFELINGTNIFFGNANNPDKEVQPYIIVSGRDMVQNLKDEAKLYAQLSKEDIDNIQDDNDHNYEAGVDADIEVEADGYGKATYIIVYRRNKETGTIYASKCVQNAYIYRDVDTELNTYPIAWLTWEKQESQYHGKPPCAEALETQIFINLMFAMIMYYQMMTAFPKAVYNADLIDGWSNQIAQAIPVRGLGSDTNINNVAKYLEPAQMSNQIVDTIEMAYNYLKDMLNINEAAVGDVNPEEASGKSILAAVKQSSVPLENTRANMYEWIEDIGRILLDMMGTYYGTRPIVVEKDGNKSIEYFDFTQLKNIWLNVKIDVGTTNIWSDMTRKQNLANLFNQGAIELIDYLEGLDDEDIANRQQIIDKIKAKMQQIQPNPQVDPNAEYEQMAQFVESLPEDVQMQLEQLRQTDEQAYEQQVKQLMMGGANNGQSMPVM